MQRDSSHKKKNFVNAACFSSENKKNSDKEKRRWKSWFFRKAETGGKNRKILQKNKLGSVPVY